MRSLHSSGTTTYSGIAKALNDQGLLSHMGTPFHPPGVKKLMARLGLDSPHSYATVGYRRRTAAEIAAASGPLQSATEAAGEFEQANARQVAAEEQRVAAILDAAAAPAAPRAPLRPVAAALADVVEELRAEAPKVDVTEAVITGGPPQDHLDTTRHLSPRTRTRYELHKQHKKGGGKALSRMELDQMEAQFLARGGQVTKCPPCTGADGFDHLKAQR
ncbi:hypothetical protein [Methylobacterium ajmalii]|uniref:hypothetical protein n=1 Tax=Methylobacterium ajmalii TaxID=2738439 RepID=UPI002F352072